MNVRPKLKTPCNTIGTQVDASIKFSTLYFMKVDIIRVFTSENDVFGKV